MAIFSPEVLALFLTAFIANRLNTHLQFSHRLLNGLQYAVPPSQEEVARLNDDPLPKKGKRVSKKKKEQPRKEAADADADAPRKQFSLDLSPIEHGDLIRHFFYHEFSNVALIGFVALLLAAFSEAWSCYTGQPQHTVSLLPLFFVAGLCMWYLFHVMFVTANEERVIGLMMGGLFGCFGLFMVFPNAHFDALGFDLEAGLQDMISRQEALVTALQVAVPLSVSARLQVFKVCSVAAAAGFAGVTVLPSLRMARVFHDSFRDNGVGVVRKAALVLNLFAPLLVMLSFVDALTGDFVVHKELVACGRAGMRDCWPSGFQHDGSFFVTETQWGVWRIGGVVATALLRLVLLRYHAQAFLLQGARGIFEQLGGNSRISVEAARARLIGFYQVLCMFALQYLAPPVLALTWAALLKRQGELALGLCGSESASDPLPPPATPGSLTEYSVDNIDQLIAEVQAVPVLTFVFWKGFLGFTLFWGSLSSFFSQFCGVVYYRRFPGVSSRSEANKVKSG